MANKILFLVLLVSVSRAFYILPSTKPYSLAMDYSGAAFFDNFDFFTGADPTNGHVKFVDLTTANSTSMAGFLSGGPLNGSVYLGADSTNISPAGRSAIRVSSKQKYNHGLFIAEIGHMPGGICGTWPAFWLLGTSSEWPVAGEIDVLEGVNDQRVNEMTLHTNQGVSISNATRMTGTLTTTNCDVNAPGQDKNVGCGVVDQANQTSFGTSFNNHGGGVFATEYTSEGIKIWFFPNGSVPADIVEGTPNPGNSSWGPPNALFANNLVNWDGHFCELELIFDLTFCGDWAGKVWSNSSCSSLAPTCEEYVSNNPSAFQDAYWAINGLKVYQQANDTYARRVRRAR